VERSNPLKKVPDLNKGGWAYILSNLHRTALYTGMSSDLRSRVSRHRLGEDVRSFTYRYNATRLVWYEWHGSIEAAIAREKQIKAGSRAKKIALIEGLNPEWKDLYDEI
jgi:putative endonuclease